MKKSETLLRAVIDAPDDDAPRLAYAEWERKFGDPARADFIRVQCALARMPAEAPERPALLAQEHDLLTEYGWKWAEPFGETIQGWLYQRGFVERVDMWLGRSADEIVGVLRKAPVRHLRDCSQFDDLGEVAKALPHFDQLTGLEFWSLYLINPTRSNALAAEILHSRHLRNLRTLILQHDRNGNLFGERVLMEAVRSPARARTEELALNVDGCWRGPSNPILTSMAESRYLRKLRKLNLSSAGGGCRRGRNLNLKTVSALGQSRNFRNLDELDLGRTHAESSLWDEMLEWPWLAGLKWLRLHDAYRLDRPRGDLKDDRAYREAFESRVRWVDWETEFIDPYVGNCWKGLTWRDRPKGKRSRN